MSAISNICVHLSLNHHTQNTELMEGERKKRKVEYEEEDEERKIEQFFALIKSTRQVSHLLRGSSKWPKKKRYQNTKEVDQEKAAGGSVWNLAFQPEDFLDQDDKGTSAGHGASPSTVQEENEEDKGGIGLDLKLSL